MRQAVFALVAEARVPLVLDADGLNALNGDLEPLRTRQTLGAPTILTPHDGEYARLAGQPVGDDRIAAAQRLADRSTAVVLAEGPGTVIAEPAIGGRPGRVALNDTGGTALATAGSGDVLTGVIAGFLARGVPAFEARGAAALGCTAAPPPVAASIGDTGVVASDVVAAVAPTLHDLTLHDLSASRRTAPHDRRRHREHDHDDRRRHVVARPDRAGGRRRARGHASARRRSSTAARSSASCATKTSSSRKPSCTCPP